LLKYAFYFLSSVNGSVSRKLLLPHQVEEVGFGDVPVLLIGLVQPGGVALNMVHRDGFKADI